MRYIICGLEFMSIDDDVLNTRLSLIESSVCSVSTTRVIFRFYIRLRKLSSQSIIMKVDFSDFLALCSAGS